MLIEFTRRYCMAHRLLADPDSKCAMPHGHNEIVRVRLRGRAALDLGHANHAAPFDALKRRWHAWIDQSVDHALQLNRNDPLVDFFRQHEPQRLDRIMTFDGDPTTEALALAFHHKLTAFLRQDAPDFACEEVMIEETPTKTVILRAADLSAAEAGWRPGDWCGRADMSINDLRPSAVLRMASH